MRKLLPLLAILALLLIPLASRTGATEITCSPGGFDTNNVATTIIVGPNQLKGEFWYPYPGAGNTWAANSLPGIAMTHGYNRSFADLEAKAEGFARNCFVVLIYNYRGMGPNDEVDTRFTFYGDLESDDLRRVTGGDPGGIVRQRDGEHVRL